MSHPMFQSLKTPVPTFDPAVASELLASRYGLDGELSPLSSERDQNFLVDAGDAGRFVLKFAGLAEPANVTNFQNQALEHLAAKDPTFPAPRVVRTEDGEPMFEATSATGDVHRVRLLSWLAGVPLDEAEGVESVAAQMGATLARLGQLLGDFEHPGSHYGLPWDIHNAAELAELLPHVEDDGLQALCEDRIRRFNKLIVPRQPGFRQQVIYNDMNPSNLLVDPDDVNRLVGVIDFGDMVHSELVNDVAIAAAYLCKTDGDPFAEVIQFLSAYSRVESLEDEEIELLPELIPARHLTTVMISHWRSAMYPENREYILRSEKRARRMLEIFANANIEATRERFRDACISR
jgi:Ser/Thr protein kinase RdoA (MazF antagonist)